MTTRAWSGHNLAMQQLCSLKKLLEQENLGVIYPLSPWRVPFYSGVNKCIITESDFWDHHPHVCIFS
jgi:hypothetical protein